MTGFTDDIAHEIDKELNPEKFTLEALLREAFSESIEREIYNPIVREPFRILGYSIASAPAGKNL